MKDITAIQVIRFGFFFSLVFLFGSTFNYMFAPNPDPEWHTAPYVFLSFLYVAAIFYVDSYLQHINYYLNKLIGLLLTIGLFLWVWLAIDLAVEFTEFIAGMVAR